MVVWCVKANEDNKKKYPHTFNTYIHILLLLRIGIAIWCSEMGCTHNFLLDTHLRWRMLTHKVVSLNRGVQRLITSSCVILLIRLDYTLRHNAACEWFLFLGSSAVLRVGQTLRNVNYVYAFVDASQTLYLNECNSAFSRNIDYLLSAISDKIYVIMLMWGSMN